MMHKKSFSGWARVGVGLLVAAILTACLADPSTTSTGDSKGLSNERTEAFVCPPALLIDGICLAGGVIKLTSSAPTLETPVAFGVLVAEVPINGQFQFTPHFDPTLQSDATVVSTTWTISGGVDASVSSTGLVTAGAKPGLGILEANSVLSYPFDVDTYTVVPIPVLLDVVGPASITVSPETETIQKGATASFTALGLFDANGVKSSETVTSSVTWTSSDPAVASVSAEGVVTGLSVGKSTIEASFSGVTGSGEIAVDANTVVDAGTDSGKPEDAGFVDSGTEDSGKYVDAGFDSGKYVDSGEPDSSKPEDAGIDSGKTEDAGKDSGNDAGLCTTLDLTSAPIVNSTTVYAAPPPTIGGTITPGTYVLTATTFYFPPGSSTSASNPPTQQVFQITADTILYHTLEYTDPDAGFDSSDGGNIYGDFVVGSTYTVSGGTQSYTFVCGATGSGTEQYTANATGIVLTYSLGNGGASYSTYALQ
jgi:hypothetical protein